mmetsp:Transcript_96802/g.134324  ORF Transcript_96802/g.134324 Transcript_96802/m.134324 type:complete len:265 (-) Transcript_96802:649-1443(-)
MVQVPMILDLTTKAQSSVCLRSGGRVSGHAADGLENFEADHEGAILFVYLVANEADRFATNGRCLVLEGVLDLPKCRAYKQPANEKKPRIAAKRKGAVPARGHGVLVLVCLHIRRPQEAEFHLQGMGPGSLKLWRHPGGRRRHQIASEGQFRDLLGRVLDDPIDLASRNILDLGNDVVQSSRPAVQDVEQVSVFFAKHLLTVSEITGRLAHQVLQCIAVRFDLSAQIVQIGREVLSERIRLVHPRLEVGSLPLLCVLELGLRPL